MLGVYLNEREEAVLQRYRRSGWQVLRGGAPDFLMLKVAENRVVEVKAVEVKGPHSDLTYEQRIYRVILEQAGIEFKVEVMK